MNNRINYHKELKEKASLWQESGILPRLLLHSCCAPCSSTCLEFLTRFCSVTVLYYNPNITIREEYLYRLAEQKRLIDEMPFEHPAELIEGRYDPEEYFALARGLEDAPERGPRCRLCYELRLKETARIAAERDFDFFATTLTLSPLKPADTINEIGIALDPVRYLPTDFKKDGGYLRSIELSKEYGLYRQNFCGCVYSRRDRT